MKYRMIADAATLQELPEPEWQKALANAMRRADERHIAIGASLDQIRQELADLRKRGDEIRSRFDG